METLVRGREGVGRRRRLMAGVPGSRELRSSAGKRKLPMGIPSDREEKGEGWCRRADRMAREAWHAALAFPSLRHNINLRPLP